MALLFSVATLGTGERSGRSRACRNSPPSDLQAQRRLAAAYETAGRRLDAVTAWTRVTELAPQAPSGWLRARAGLQCALAGSHRLLEDRAEAAVWRQLLIADGLLATGHLTDAFAIYRSIEASSLRW